MTTHNMLGNDLKVQIERMKKGEHVKILIGTGHAKSTCQGAAFEYIMNVEQELNRHKVRDKATLPGFQTNMKWEILEWMV